MKFEIELNAGDEKFNSLVEFLNSNNIDYTHPHVLLQCSVSGSLPLAELGDFVDWITDIHFKQYAEGWCQAGGSNGWHCTTDELIEMFRNRGNDR